MNDPWEIFAIVFVVWWMIGACWTYWKFSSNHDFGGMLDRIVITSLGGCMGLFAFFFWWLRYDF